MKTKHTLCLQWWTQSILKKLQEGHTEDLKAFWNSKIEVKCVKPHAREQTNEVRINRDFIWLRDPPNILEHTTILLLPHYPHQECRHQIPYVHWRNGKQIWFGTSNKPTKAKDDGKQIRVPPTKKSLIEIQTGNFYFGDKVRAMNLNFFILVTKLEQWISRILFLK